MWIFNLCAQSLSSRSVYMSGLSRNAVQVFFWFWEQDTDSTAGVFCRPTMQLFDVTAYASLNNNSLTNVTVIDNYPAANNVSGFPLNGIPYNGYVFLLPHCLSHYGGLCRLVFNTSTDVNVQSRANSIKSGIPNAIFRQAQQAPGGSKSVFQNPNGFLDFTEQIYVCRPSSLR